jgi:hypothetical protein
MHPASMVFEYRNTPPHPAPLEGQKVEQKIDELKGKEEELQEEQEIDIPPKDDLALASSVYIDRVGGAVDIAAEAPWTSVSPAGILALLVFVFIHLESRENTTRPVS